MSYYIEKLDDFLRRKEHIVCYGAGGYGKEILAHLLSRNKCPEMFVVSSEDHPKSLLDIPIVCIKDIMDKKKYSWIISMNKINSAEVIKVLDECGINEYFDCSESLIDEIRSSVLARNSITKNMGRGKKRCFILATGTSILKQNLKLLKEEDVISCSYTGLLSDYSNIAPEFYVTPSVFSDGLDTEYAEQALRLRDEIVVSQYVFLDYADRLLVEKYNLFKGKEVFYVLQNLQPLDSRFDLTDSTFIIYTASIMCLKIAMYMGYKEIYLLGVDHSECSGIRSYKHSYDEEKIRKMGYNHLYELFVKTNSTWIETVPNRVLYKLYADMFMQYHMIAEKATELGIQVYNLSPESGLDEFPKISYKDIFT